MERVKGHWNYKHLKASCLIFLFVREFLVMLWNTDTVLFWGPISSNQEDFTYLYNLGWRRGLSSGQALQVISETSVESLICRAVILKFKPHPPLHFRVALTHVYSMLINDKSSQGSQMYCPSKSLLMLLCLTTEDSAACVPVFIHLRKYHPKPHLSCIGCSLTFHFVWQTLIFTSKVLSRRHPTHT